MKRMMSAVLLVLSLVLTGGCQGSQSGDSVSDRQSDEVPGSKASRGPS